MAMNRVVGPSANFLLQTFVRSSSAFPPDTAKGLLRSGKNASLMIDTHWGESFIPLREA